MDKRHSHLLYYSVIIGIFTVCFLLALIYGITKPAKMLLVLTVALSYVGLGIAHHHKDHDLTIRIVFEYMCFASLGIGIVFFALGS